LHPIHPREWRWVGLFAGLLLVLVAIPYAIAILRPPEGLILARTFHYGNDLSQYLAAMGDGMRSGSWLVHDHFTSEPHDPALMYPLYVLLGKVAGLLSSDPLVVFALAVSLSTIAFVFACYVFAAAFLDSLRQRLTALVFIVFYFGSGILVAAVVSTASPEDSGRAIFAFDRAEISTFFLPFGSPHLLLALALIMVGGRAVAEWIWEGRRGALLLLTLSVLGVGLLNPFSMITLLGIVAACAATRWTFGRRFPTREVSASAMMALVAAPMLLASYLTFSLDPFWSAAYGRQNTTGSSPVWVLAVEFAPLLPLALWGAAWTKGRREARVMLSLWIVALLLMMYSPVPFQRRFGFGFQPALAVLAALGVARLEQALYEARIRARARKLIAASATAVPVSGAVLAYAILVMAALGNGVLAKAIFEPGDTVEVASWLMEHADASDVVLASMETGNYLGGRIAGRVVLGHGVGTLDSQRKGDLVKTFFDSATSEAQRKDILFAERVTYVVLGSRERVLGGDSLPRDNSLTLVHDAGDTRIYRVAAPLP
jgi:hypothetical protein